jgi:iron complex outermembrane receptor protein
MQISRLALAASLIALPALAHAADEADADRGATIVVTADRPEPDAEVKRIAGGAAIVSADRFKSTPVQNLKDIVAYVPGVILQPRFGDESRISIRGSGLSLNYHARGLMLLLDGVPTNTADGMFDFIEVDPSAYARVEVYKGANALRYGANTLGGAINLVTPTGRDAARFQARIDGGSFGYVKGQASTGGSAGRFDWFVTASAQRSDGYREHSRGDALRGHLNLGYRIADNVETRLYVTGASTNQRIPGEVAKPAALGNPRAANPAYIALDEQRNVDTIRLANKTIITLGGTSFELGAFYNHRHVDHPIFEYLDHKVHDYGGFVRLVDERPLGAMHNRLVVGANLQNGTTDNRRYVNFAATKGALTFSAIDRSRNFSAYFENSLTVAPGVTLIGGLQYLHATRSRQDRFLTNGDHSGSNTFDLWSPRIGLLWDAGPDWQVFANVSRSAEVPSFDANTFATPSTSNLRPQRATTYEIGTRGRHGAGGWDVSLYRAELTDELQCLTTGPFSTCSVVNAGRTVHQGIEAGLDASVPLGRSGFKLAAQLAYTYSDFRFDGDPLYGDNELAGIPPHLLRAEVLLRHGSGFYVGPNVEWAPGHYFADNANTLTVDPYVLVGVKLGYDPGERWSFYLEGRNLTDATYISTVAVAGTAPPGAQLFNPGTGRAVFAGLRFAL